MESIGMDCPQDAAAVLGVGLSGTWGQGLGSGFQSQLGYERASLHFPVSSSGG